MILGAWLVILTKFSEERIGEGRLTRGMRRFSNVIEDLELRDLPLQGGPFRWSGDLNNLSKSRLDRFLIYENWEEHFGGAVQSVLPRPISNHFPILLDGGGGVSWGPSPFRFELKAEDFKEIS